MARTAATSRARRGALVLGLAMAAIVAAASPRLRGLLANTGLLAGGVLAISLPIGAVLGVVIAKIDLPGRRTMAWLLLAMLVVPLYVQAVAWQAMLGSGGWVAQATDAAAYARPWLEGWRGAIWVHAMAAVPWVALLTAAALLTVERRLEEESLLDASPLRVLWRVSLRRAAGGTAAAAAWIAVVCATEITVTDYFQVRTFAEEVFTEASFGSLAAGRGSLAASDLALGATALALLVAAGLWLAFPWLPAAASLPAEATWRWHPAGRRRGALAVAAWAIVAVVVLVPVAGLLWKAGVDVDQQGGAYQRSWSASKVALLTARSPWDHRREWGWSLSIGALAAAATTIIALLGAWLVRIRPAILPAAGLAVAAAIALPAPLVGVWVIELLNHPADSPLAPLTWLYYRTLLAPVLVQTFRAAPLAMIWLWSQLATVPSDLLEAARSEGAGPVAQFVRVALPLRRTAVAAAAAAALVIAVGELSATLLVAPPGVTTISIRVFQLLHFGVDDRVAALSLAIFVAAGAAMGALALATRGKRHG